MKPRRPNLSYANTMSTIAVVLALGTGSAYAAATIGSAEVVDGSLVSADVKDSSLSGNDILNSSLGGAEITNESLTHHDVRDGTLRGQDVDDGGLGGVDIRNGSITAVDVDESTLATVPSASNAAHATSAGHATEAGKAPVQGYQVITRQAPFDQTVDKEQAVDVPCPPGKRPIGGGGMAYTGAHTPDNNEVAIVESRPVGGYVYGPDDNRPEAWRVKAEATDRATYNSVIYVTAYAICAQTDMP